MVAWRVERQGETSMGATREGATQQGTEAGHPPTRPAARKTCSRKTLCWTYAIQKEGLNALTSIVPKDQPKEAL